nr:DNA-directed RNA polymerase subunit [Kaumoebavirus]
MTLWSNEVFAAEYRKGVFRVVMHLDPTSRLYVESLHKKIESGEIGWKELASMTEQQLDPEHSEKIRATIKLAAEQKVEKKISKQLTCRKCAKNEVETESKQLRGGDEGMTVLANCLYCGNRWYMN